MKKIRGFKLGRKLVKVFTWVSRPGRKNCRNSLLRPPTPSYNPLCRIWSFARFLRGGSKGLSSWKSDPGYIQLGKKGVQRVEVPKGHLAVYIGESEGETRRVVVPVILFQSPAIRGAVGGSGAGLRFQSIRPDHVALRDFRVREG